MTKNINAIALEKGYQIEKEPVYFYVPFLGGFRLPIWLTWDWQYITPKGSRYTQEAILFKLKRKSDRAKLKQLLKERKRLIKERELRNEQLRILKTK